MIQHFYFYSFLTYSEHIRKCSKLQIMCLRVDSSSHQGKWVSAIALLAADPTMVRTAGAAKRCRTTTDNFNLFPYFKVEMIFFHSFNVKMISLFNFIKQLANSKSFLEQYSTPDETKIKYKCHLQNSN